MPESGRAPIPKLVTASFNVAIKLGLWRYSIQLAVIISEVKTE